MKLSIISVAFNAEATIRSMLDSVSSQRYPSIEHIVIDGGSTDRTLELVRLHGRRVSKVVSEPDRGVWDAMNKGIRLATGDVVGFLNADDEYFDSEVVDKIMATMSSSLVDACYADLIYVDRINTRRVIRNWISCPFTPGLFTKGWVPAHPTFYVRRSVYEHYGVFDLAYPFGADYELALRLLEIARIPSQYVPGYWVRMRMGGQSNRSIGSVIPANLEAYRAARAHGLNVGPLFPIRKILSRLPQYLPVSLPKSAE